MLLVIQKYIISARSMMNHLLLTYSKILTIIGYNVSQSANYFIRTIWKDAHFIVKLRLSSSGVMSRLSDLPVECQELCKKHRYAQQSFETMLHVNALGTGEFLIESRNYHFQFARLTASNQYTLSYMCV